MNCDGASQRRAEFGSLWHSTNGSILAEYLTALSLASLLIAAAITEFGAARSRSYRVQRDSLYQPYP
ncbi:MAG TPA: hypothetical protein VIV60_02670 [Polyangiaceae bacterium]